MCAQYLNTTEKYLLTTTPKWNKIKPTVTVWQILHSAYNKLHAVAQIQHNLTWH